MVKIQKVSSYLLIVFNILLIALPLLIMLRWLFIDTTASDAIDSITYFFSIFDESIQTPEGYVNLSAVDWTPALQLLGFIADMIGLLPFLISLFVLKAIFKNYQKAKVFSVRNAILYRRLGILFLLDALFIKSFSQTLMVLTITLTNPPGHRYLSVSFGTPNLTSLFYGILVIIGSWVMLEASKLYDEQKFTI